MGQRADLVELDAELRVRRVMRAGTWFAADAGEASGVDDGQRGGIASNVRSMSSSIRIVAAVTTSR